MKETYRKSQNGMLLFMGERKTLAIAFTFLALVMAEASATTVGYYTDNNTSVTHPAVPINQAGFTATQITNISTFDLTTIDMLMVNEYSNSGLSSAMSGRLANIETWVRGGGKMIVHDRFVSNDMGDPQSNPFLVGAAYILVDRDFSIRSDLDIVLPGNTLVTNGPHGTLTNTSLDGGTSSSHGFAVASSLPGDAVSILQIDGSNTKVAAFSYGLDNGFVYYSTIPLDYYLAGAGPNPPRDNFNMIYAPNVLAYVQAIPEPTTICLLGLGGLGLLRRRKSA